MVRDQEQPESIDKGGLLRSICDLVEILIGNGVPASLVVVILALFLSACGGSADNISGSGVPQVLAGTTPNVYPVKVPPPEPERRGSPETLDDLVIKLSQAPFPSSERDKLEGEMMSELGGLQIRGELNREALRLAWKVVFNRDPRERLWFYQTQLRRAGILPWPENLTPKESRLLADCNDGLEIEVCLSIIEARRDAIAYWQSPQGREWVKFLLDVDVITSQGVFGGMSKEIDGGTVARLIEWVQEHPELFIPDPFVLKAIAEKETSSMTHLGGGQNLGNFPYSDSRDAEYAKRLVEVLSQQSGLDFKSGSIPVSSSYDNPIQGKGWGGAVGPQIRPYWLWVIMHYYNQEIGGTLSPFEPHDMTQLTIWFLINTSALDGKPGWVDIDDFAGGYQVGVLRDMYDYGFGHSQIPSRQLEQWFNNHDLPADQEELRIMVARLLSFQGRMQISLSQTAFRGTHGLKEALTSWNPDPDLIEGLIRAHQEWHN